MPGTQWWPFLLRGLLGLAYGSLALAFPDATAAQLIAFVATYVLIDGMMTLMSGVHLRQQLQRGWLLLAQGAFSLAYGILAYRNLHMSLATMVVLGSGWWLLTSTAHFLVARGQPEIASTSAWSVLEAILSLALAGAVVLGQLAVPAVVLLFAWLGVFVGLGRLVVALEVRNRRAPQRS